MDIRELLANLAREENRPEPKPLAAVNEVHLTVADPNDKCKCGHARKYHTVLGWNAVTSKAVPNKCKYKQCIVRCKGFRLAGSLPDKKEM